MHTVRMLSKREIVVKKEVYDAFEVPCIDFVGGVEVEVMNNGQGAVYLSGVLLKGVKMESCDPNWTSFPPRAWIRLRMPFGSNQSVSFIANKVTLVSGHIPPSAKLVETLDGEGTPADKTP